VVSAFPLIGWRYSRVERGAVIVALTAGVLQELGLAEQYVVLAVGGRDIADAAGFAQIVGDEYAGLVDRGGDLRLKVQAADGAPREFAASIKPARAETAPEGVKRPRGNAPSGNGVNVWDKVNGGRGSSRDDPTQ
jgi:hypothetical protein